MSLQRERGFKSSCVVFPPLTVFFLTKPEGHSDFLCTDFCWWAVPISWGWPQQLAVSSSGPQALSCTFFLLAKRSALIVDIS